MSVSKVKTRDYPITDPKRGINYVKFVNGNYTVRNEDKGWLIVIDASFPATVLVPPLSIPIGSQIDFFRVGTSTISFSAVPNANIMSSGAQLADQYTAATLIKISDTDYLLVGKLS